MDRSIFEVKLRRIGHVSVSLFDNRLLLIWGGYMQHQESEDELPIFRYHDPQEIILYDPLLESWSIKSTHGEVPPANSGTCGVFVDDCLYIYGGYFGEPDVEGNSNNLYSLNLKTWVWTRLEPSGLKPLHCDKLMGWSYKKCLYFFGGFGTPPASSDMTGACEFVMDRSHQWYYGRGWNNQLVKYNIENKQWERPATIGKRPSPRAAMAGFQESGKVYIFGGRLLNTRMNDLYVLDLETMKWSNDLNSGKGSPKGRSWHTFTPISSSQAILYGGLSSDGVVMDDMWLYSMKEDSWTELELPAKREKRLWHQAACLDAEWIAIGGVRTNLHSNQHEPLVFARKLLSIAVTPKSLLRLCIEKISSFKTLDDEAVCYLPKYLQNVIRVRNHNISQSLAAQLTNMWSNNLYES